MNEPIDVAAVRSARRVETIGDATLHLCDCAVVLASMPSDSIDAIVTDPPAGIGFMGKEWDRNRGGRDGWVEWLTSVMADALRVLKPGGHALVWALPRTSHWTAWALEEAGFEVRDRVSHLFGSGFPKSLDVSKAIDKAAGERRERKPDKRGVSSPRTATVYAQDSWTKANGNTRLDDTPLTSAAAQWTGYGTALKPAVEDWWLCRKPLSESTVAMNVLKWGTGALNVDACRIPSEPIAVMQSTGGRKFEQTHNQPNRTNRQIGTQDFGRWPAHLTHDGSDVVLAGFPITSDENVSPVNRNGARQMEGWRYNGECLGARHPGTGSAARYFYCAKASADDRGTDNKHPTVKSIELMRWLCRLVTPPGGTILDAFAGSGSTLIAAEREGFASIGVEQHEPYFEIALARLKAEAERTPMLAGINQTEPPPARQTSFLTEVRE